MQIPILNGIYTDETPDFRTSFPKNMIPVPKPNGISQGYLRPADGIVEFGTGPGIDRGGINWNGVYYRVMGTSLISIASDGTYTTIGTIPGTNQVTMTYSFDYLAINGDNKLYLYNGTTLTQITDTDLGNVIDVIWVDGYFMTTDGSYLVVTELNDPFAVNPLKYGSSEINPDNVVALKKIHNEVYAINRYTIEIFSNVGGINFPFQRVEGAQIDRGSIGTQSCIEYMNAVAFLGGSLNESPAIWIGTSGSSVKISNQDIDKLILNYTEIQLQDVVFETRADQSHQFLYVHLPDHTLVYDGAASQVIGQPIWFTLHSGLACESIYRAKNFVYVYDKWHAGDPTSSSYGYLDPTISSHYGNLTGWCFSTSILYNQSRGAIFHELELKALTGRVIFGDDPTISTSWSEDGETWSQDFYIDAGKSGNRNIRLVWLRQGVMRNWRIQRFRGTSDAHISIAALEATIEPLGV